MQASPIRPLRKSVGTSGTVMNYPYYVVIDDPQQNQAAYKWLLPAMAEMGIEGGCQFCWGWSGEFRFKRKDLATAFAQHWAPLKYARKV